MVKKDRKRKDKLDKLALLPLKESDNEVEDEQNVVGQVINYFLNDDNKQGRPNWERLN